MSKPFEHGTIEAEGAYLFGDDLNIVAEYSRRFAQKRADGTYLVVTDYYVAEGRRVLHSQRGGIHALPRPGGRGRDRDRM